MKVIFLDFDGVLNSETSFEYERRRRTVHKEQGVKGPVNETLSNQSCAAFQWVLDCYPEVKVVISSAWRTIYDLEWLKAKLASYHIDSSRIIDRTPVDPGCNRGLEINTWLQNHPEVTHYAIIDDNDEGITTIHGTGRFVWTNWFSGMHMGHAEELKDKLSNWHKKHLDELGMNAGLPRQ
jgi:hypothetical protein